MDSVERFIKYVKIHTTADDNSSTYPSAERIKDLGKVLVEELLELGLKDAHMDEYGNVYAHLEGEGYPIGFNAHMDTALEVSGENVKPRIVKNYDGKDIKLNDTYTLSPSQFPGVLKHIGHDLVVTDGTTLLGGDDKAGVAAIMSMLEFYKNNPQIKHHPISVAFTCDEEIGRGADKFDIKKMNAEFAYTVDGSEVNNVDYINFDAQGVKMHVQGVAVHPGEGKNQLVNALMILKEWLNYLPDDDTPFDSDDGQGYWFLCGIQGTSEACEAYVTLRAFSKEDLKTRSDKIANAAIQLRNKYPKAVIEYNIFDQYENMESYVRKDPRAVELADAAIRKNGLVPAHTKIRGGTDGATFSKMGLITPNLGTGSYNHHGRYEYLDIQEYKKLIDIIVDIVRL